MIRADSDNWRLAISTGHTARTARPIPPERKRFHADRVLATYTQEHVRALLALARAPEGRWSHVDWNVVEAGLAPAEACEPMLF